MSKGFENKYGWDNKKIIAIKKILELSQGNDLKVGNCSKPDLRNSFADISDDEYQYLIDQMIKYGYLMEDDEYFVITSKGYNSINSDGYFRQISPINMSTLILLKRIYALDKSTLQLSISKDTLIKNALGYSISEVEDSLNYLEENAYLDISEEGVIITPKGVSLVKNNRRLKTAWIIVMLVLAVLCGFSLINRYTWLIPGMLI